VTADENESFAVLDPISRGGNFIDTADA